MSQPPPTVTLDAKNLHVPDGLRLIARKMRGTDPKGADALEATANAFAAWRRENPRA